MKLEYVEMVGFRGFRDKIRFNLPSGFAVLSGHNGTGKSTLLDGIDFALTGTINKFTVTEAKGGGLEEHIWWVGQGLASEHYVSVGFIDDTGKRLTVTRSRERGCEQDARSIMRSLCASEVSSTINDLIQTSLIRAERISALSLDLPEQARFAAVRAAIGGLVGPDLKRPFGGPEYVLHYLGRYTHRVAHRVENRCWCSPLRGIAERTSRNSWKRNRTQLVFCSQG